CPRLARRPPESECGESCRDRLPRTAAELGRPAGRRSPPIPGARARATAPRPGGTRGRRWRPAGRFGARRRAIDPGAPEPWLEPYPVTVPRPGAPASSAPTARRTTDCLRRGAPPARQDPASDLRGVAGAARRYV